MFWEPDCFVIKEEIDSIFALEFVRRIFHWATVVTNDTELRITMPEKLKSNHYCNYFTFVKLHALVHGTCKVIILRCKMYQLLIN